jgi:UDP-N-acetylmuramyl pentapeptide phosphotransferase/UDP-N-acetylglucosamine-1-phosphate transferase
MENQTEQTSQSMATWLKYALIGGGIAILLYVIPYIFNERILFEQSYAWIIIAVLLVTGVLAAIERKKKQNNTIPFGQAVGTSFSAYAVATLIYTAFTSLLQFVIDPKFMVRAREFQMEKLQERLDKGEFTKQQYDKVVEFMGEMSNGKMVMFIVVFFVVMLVIGLVIFLISSSVICTKEEEATFR